VQGSGNVFTNENFWGTTPDLRNAKVPCMWFTGTRRKHCVGAENGQALQGFDVCTQIFDATLSPQYPLGQTASMDTRNA